MSYLEESRQAPVNESYLKPLSPDYHDQVEKLLAQSRLLPLIEIDPSHYELGSANKSEE